MNNGKLSGVFMLETFTPVHIGMGETITALDYTLEKGRYRVQDVQAFFESNADNPQYAIDALENGLRLPKEFTRYEMPALGFDIPTPQRREQQAPRADQPIFAPKGKMDPQMAKLMKKVHGGAPPPAAAPPKPQAAPRQTLPEVRAFMKDPFGRPFIPGSSLKGALRTAIVRAMTQDGYEAVIKSITNQQPNRNGKYNSNFAFKPANDLLFGGKVQSDPFKVFTVRDSQPIPITEFAACRVDMMNLKGERFETDHRKAYAETWMPGHALEVPFHLDIAALNRDDGVCRTAAPLLGDKEAFEKVLREHSEALVEGEITFYDEMRHPAGANPFRSAQAAGALLLPIGHGAGWLTKTIGSLLTEGDMAKIRDIFNLGRRGVDCFPKTRKFAQSDKGPLPMGWLKLRIQWDA